MELKHLLIVAALIISVNSKSLTPPEREGKLSVISLSEERLEMVYHRSAREAIYVISEVQNDGETVHLLITTMDGREVFSVDRPSYSTALWSFEGSSFLLMNETQPDSSFKFTSYFAPSEYSHTLKSTVNRKKQLRPGLLNLLDHDSVNETSRKKIEEFLAHPEVSLLIEAAEALGESGVQGQSSQPAMVFFTAALRFSKWMDETNEDGSGTEMEIDNPLFPAAYRQKRWLWPSRCSNNYYCRICPMGYNCFGLCGRGCDCWQWVCGHCCFSPGCAAHDAICSIRDEHYSPECILTAPLALVCWLF